MDACRESQQLDRDRKLSARRASPPAECGAVQLQTSSSARVQKKINHWKFLQSRHKCQNWINEQWETEAWTEKSHFL